MSTDERDLRPLAPYKAILERELLHVRTLCDVAETQRLPGRSQATIRAASCAPDVVVDSSCPANAPR